MADMTSLRPRRDAGSLDSPRTSAPTSRSPTPNPHLQQQPSGSLKCCCGRTDCIYLMHNCTVLESVENDVRTAAKLGQSLLERHEAYMVDAERDRAELIKHIDQLEMDKKELEAENAEKIKENRVLLDQLETLNTSVADSDTHIKILEATLQSSQQIIRRLEGAAERAEDMERHIAALEAEQVALQNCLVTSESEARSALQRWKRAERGIADLQDQLDRMEKETREENERHMEIVTRMERQRAVEKELHTAAGRLKGAAAAKSLHDSKNNRNGVVTHFVRDLLEDNASLQLGMAELRGMLMNSNDEIQILRDQLMFHQPLIDGENNASAASTLRAELLDKGMMPGSPEPKDADLEHADTPTTPSNRAPSQCDRRRISMSQELHIHHHHYHVNKKAETKKPKKKRVSLTPGVFIPPVALPMPATPRSRQLHACQQDTSSVTPGSSPPFPMHRVNRDSISTVVSGPSNRWSMFSDQPSDLSMSSVPSSPRTEPRTSFFDRTIMSDLSMPASPTTSVDPVSPIWRPNYRRASLDDSKSCGWPFPMTCQSTPDQPPVHEPIKEVDENTSSHEEDDVGTGDEAQASGSCNADDVPDFASNETGTADESAPSEATTPTPTPAQPSPFPDDDVVPDDNVLSLSVSMEGDEESPFVLPSKHHRTLHRAVSHESIISLQGGLDIHTLTSRPSQLTLRPLGTAIADTGISSVTARPVISRASRDKFQSNNMLRDSLSLGISTPRSGRTVSGPVTPSTNANIMSSPMTTAAGSLSGAQRLGRIVAWRPWGSNVRSSSANAESSAVAPAVVTSTVETAAGTIAVTAASAVATGTADSCASEASQEPWSGADDAVSTSATLPRASSSTLATPALSMPGVVPAKRYVNGSKSASHSPAAKAVPDLAHLRSPGINQPGAIPGFFEYWSAHQRRGVPSKVQADVIDEEALRDSLMGS